jgi:hypothetical protein
MAKYAQNGLRMHLLQSRISTFSAYQRLGLSLTCASDSQPTL